MMQDTKLPEQQPEADAQNKLSALIAADETMKAAKSVKLPVQQAITEGIQQAVAENKKLTGKQRRKLEKKQRREGSGQWAEVDSIALACSQMLQVGGHLLPMLQRRELLLQVQNRQLLNRLINSINRDTRQLAIDFKKIYELHKGKEGTIKGDEDLMLSYSVFSDYVNFTELANSCLVPTLAHASEILAEALERLRAINPELAAQIDYESVNYHFLKAKQAMDGITGAGPSAEEREQQAQAEPAVA